MSYTHNMYTVYKYALMVHKQLHGPVAGIIYCSYTKIITAK